MTKPILYSYFRSSASFRVRFALAYKGIDYEYHAINLVKDGGEQRSSDYEKLNSMHQVPTFVVDGVMLTQSLPIIERKYPEKSLLPRDLFKRAQARRIAEIINSGIQPLQNLATLKKIVDVTGVDSKKADWAKHFISKGFQGLERVLEETAGKFCVGDEVSIADLALVPQVYNAARFNVDTTSFPLICRIAEECLKLDAFQAAHPSKQPDCPEELK